VTRAFHCEVCHSFARSEELEGEKAAKHGSR